jgi:hypothetical protein
LVCHNHAPIRKSLCCRFDESQKAPLVSGTSFPKTSLGRLSCTSSPRAPFPPLPRCSSAQQSRRRPLPPWNRAPLPLTNICSRPFPTPRLPQRPEIRGVFGKYPIPVKSSRLPRFRLASLSWLLTALVPLLGSGTGGCFCFGGSPGRGDEYEAGGARRPPARARHHVAI